ncbi:PorT family protein [Salibacteraceae bacterium]|nr:PorT family protein [Salibacteraceae bacterium]MDB9709082.1 PorT family protein [Salibacteraceae bacterium]MDC1304382.1 PorT family protein [Salibacteraceae bacterium]
MGIILRITLSLFLSLLFSQNVFSQESDMDDRKVRFGLLASPNLGWMTPNISDFDKSGLQSRLGFGYGLMLDYKFSNSPNYLLSTGINLATNGGGLIEAIDSNYVGLNDTLPPTYFTGTLNRTYRFQYVNIPILLKMRTNEIGYMTYFGAIGFDLGIRTRAFANDAFDWEPGVIPGPSDEKDVNIQDRINLFRLGINLTLGGEFNLSGNTNAYFGIGWHNTFTNIFRKTAANKILIADSDGNPTINEATKRAIVGEYKSAVSNYISIDLGIYF